MLALLLLIVFGLGMAFFATQNTLGTSIVVAGNTFRDIPLYFVVVGSMLLGIFVSWLISMFGTISTFLTIYRKDTTLHVRDEEIAQLRQANHKLELENAELKGQKHTVNHTEETQDKEPRPSFTRQLKHNLGIAT